MLSRLELAFSLKTPYQEKEREFQDAHGTHNLQLAGVVFNGSMDYSPEEMLAKGEVRQIAAQNGWRVFDNEVPYSRSYAKGARLGESIYGTASCAEATEAAFHCLRPGVRPEDWLMNEGAEFDLLVDLAKLLQKYGPETFDRLAEQLSAPGFVERMTELLSGAAPCGACRPC